MPHIRIRSISEELVQSLSVEAPERLASVMQTTADNFTIELIQTSFFKNGTLVKGDPLIEVFWFARGQEIQDASAKVITELVQKLTPAEYIAVVFIDLSKQNYYENGQHF